MKLRAFSPRATYLLAPLVAAGCLIAGMAAANPAPTPIQTSYERAFMETMSNHHAQALVMAKACMDKATHQSLRNMCSSVVATQMSEIGTMQAWLHAWYGERYTPTIPPSAIPMMDEINVMYGSQYEIAFMQMLYRHHIVATTRAAPCLDRAYHGSLVSMCGGMAKTQLSEIQTLQKWLCDWYRQCKQGWTSDPNAQT